MKSRLGTRLTYEPICTSVLRRPDDGTHTTGFFNAEFNVPPACRGSNEMCLRDGPLEMNCQQPAAVRLGAEARPHENMLTLRLRSSSHTDAIATMLNEPAPSTSRG